MKKISVIIPSLLVVLTAYAQERPPEGWPIQEPQRKGVVSRQVRSCGALWDLQLAGLSPQERQYVLFSARDISLVDSAGDGLEKILLTNSISSVDGCRSALPKEDRAALFRKENDLTLRYQGKIEAYVEWRGGIITRVLFPKPLTSFLVEERFFDGSSLLRRLWLDGRVEEYKGVVKTQ